MKVLDLHRKLISSGFVELSKAQLPEHPNMFILGSRPSNETIISFERNSQEVTSFEVKFNGRVIFLLNEKYSDMDTLSLDVIFFGIFEHINHYKNEDTKIYAHS